MTKKLISFPSIEQFRNVVANINRHYNFVGLDEKGEAIYDTTLPKPKLTFNGTVKLHGTNASVCFNLVDGLWVQSRENIITPEQDNAGFAFFVEANRVLFLELLAKVMIKNNLDAENNTISIYGEWCGGNIQKGVGICNLEKSFFIFGVKITPHVDINDLEAVKKNPAYWVDHSYLKAPEKRIYNVTDYKTWSIEIDFNIPQLVQNELSEITLGVEQECPIAKAFGFSGVGEGVVWTTEVNGVVYRFKVKGMLHAGKSKVKILGKVDDVKLNKIIEVAEKVTPVWRLSQMVDKSCNLLNGGTLDRSKLGEYIRLVINDIIKEDSDIIAEAGLEPKDVNKRISEIAKNYFFEREKVIG